MDSEGSVNVSSKLLNTIKSVSPIVLSLSNALAEILPFGFQPPLNQSNTPPPPTPYDICIAVNTNASHLVYLALRSSIAANHWVTAVRLSQYEASKINYHVTLRRLGSGHSTSNTDSQVDASGPPEADGARAWKDVGLTPFKTSSVGQVKGFGTPMLMEGWVNARVGYAQTWQLLYAVVGNVNVVGDYDADRPVDAVKKNPQQQRAKKEENRTSFLKMFKGGKDKKAAAAATEKKTNSTATEADIDMPTNSNIYLAAAGGATGFKNPDLAFYESIDAYRNGEPALFRVENVSQACLDYTSFYADSFTDLCESIATAPASTLHDGARVPAVRIQGSIVGGSHPPSQDQESPHASKIPKSFLNAATNNPHQFHQGYDYIFALKNDTDPRPLPESIQFTPVIKTPFNNLDAFRWITATLGTFHLEANMISREVDLREGDLGIKPFDMEVIKMGARDGSSSSPLAGFSSALNSAGSGGRGFGVFQFAVETGVSGWGLLYLKTDEVAGLSQAPPENGVSAKKMFDLVLMDKKAARRSGFLDKWVDAVAKGVEARVSVERKEVLEKVSGLIAWLDVQKGGAGIGDVLHGSAADEVYEEQVHDERVEVQEVGVERGGVQQPEQQYQEEQLEEQQLQEQQQQAEIMTPTNERNIDLSNSQTPIAQLDTAANAVAANTPASAATGVAAVPVIPSPAGTVKGPEIVKTDLVLVAVPVLQPDGTWSWQYQFANQSSVENGGATQAFVSPSKSVLQKPLQKKPSVANDDEEDDEEEDEDEEDEEEEENEDDDEDEDSDNISLAASMHTASKRNSASLSVTAAKLKNRISGVSLSQQYGGVPAGMTTANQLNTTFGVPVIGPGGVLMSPGMIGGAGFLAVAPPKSVTGAVNKSPARNKKAEKASKLLAKKAAEKAAKEAAEEEDSNDDEGSQSEDSLDGEEEEEEEEEDDEDEEDDQEDDEDEDSQSLVGMTDIQRM
ncbi:UNVERIFIED_CONTAM: hypothetical protein HDU68_012157, partial [Siphonaria sp. JEL0065]